MSPEPQHAVTLNGVTFEVADIKALTQNIYDRTSAVMLGGRCNNEEIEHDVTGSANDECSDVNPGALHVILTNFLGLRQAPLIEDRTANYEVWNQPVARLRGHEAGRDLARPPRTSASAPTGRPSGRTTPTRRSSTKFARRSRTSARAAPKRARSATRTTRRTDDYHYILELNADGKVIGGRYCTDSSNSHVDFLWSPTGTNSPTNPSVDVDEGQAAHQGSVAPATGGGGGTGMTREFPVTPSKAIPDATPAGVNVDVPVTGVTNAKGLAVSVDITHTYRGDLVLKLLKNGTAVKTPRPEPGRLGRQPRRDATR